MECMRERMRQRELERERERERKERERLRLTQGRQLREGRERLDHRWPRNWWFLTLK